MEFGRMFRLWLCRVTCHSSKLGSTHDRCDSREELIGMSGKDLKQDPHSFPQIQKSSTENRDGLAGMIGWVVRVFLN